MDVSQSKSTKIINVLVASAFCASAFQVVAEDQQPLQLRVSAVKNQTGTLVGYLYDQSKGFPSDKSRAIETVTVSIAAGPSLLQFHSAEVGKNYAISVMHDENGNGVMDSNLIGIPKEGYATSNNQPHSMLGPPSFQKALFTRPSGRRPSTSKCSTDSADRA